MAVEFVFVGQEKNGLEELGGGFDPLFAGADIIVIHVSKSTHCWHCGKKFNDPKSIHCWYCGEPISFEGNEDVADIIDSIEHEVVHKVLSPMNLSPEIEDRMIYYATCHCKIRTVEKIPLEDPPGESGELENEE